VDSGLDAALIVGLGNPGPGYERTRHNLGFMVADEISAGLHVRFSPRPGAFDYARGTEAGITLHLVKPLTFMNLSGGALIEALAMTGTAVDRTLIVLDDFQLPLGTLRIRPAGSDGGHRGLGSVIGSLETDRVPRLRCGIGRDALPPGEERRDFVLESFGVGELAPAREMIRRAAEAARVFAVSGIEHAMTVYNTP
jgi:peptidyl-tRNA hydrolase, PTH1 family